MFKIYLSCLVFAGVSLHAQAPAVALANQPVTDVPVHDPVMIREDGTYYIFATGRGIAVWSSRDRRQWKQEAPVFAQPPAWAVEAVPTFRGHIWAPDISRHDGKYYLYYSVAAFGKITSCIGVAINVTLDPRELRIEALAWDREGWPLIKVAR